MTIKCNYDECDTCDGYLHPTDACMPDHDPDQALERLADVREQRVQGVARELARRVFDKQHKYGDAVGRTSAIMGILYPDGAPGATSCRGLLVARVVERIALLSMNGHDSDRDNEVAWSEIAECALLAIDSGSW